MSIGDGTHAPSFGQLLRDLAEEMLVLARSEIRLVRAEIARAVTGIGLGIAFVAVGAVFVMLGSLALVVGLVLLVGDQWVSADRYWIATLLVMVITGVASVLLARRGLSMASPSRLASMKTIQPREEDEEWLKRQVRSGATSN